MRHSNSMLNGIRVVELAGSLKSSYCARILAYWGAHVLRIEDADAEGESHSEAATRPWLHADKQSLPLSLADRQDLSALLDLTAVADVLVYERSSIPESLRTSLRDLVDRDGSQLVSVELSDFGSSGPWKDRPSSDLVVNALAGMCKVNQIEGGIPLREPGNQTYLLTGLAGALAAITGIVNRHQTKLGQSAEVSALETVVNILSPQVLQVSYQGDARGLSDGRGYLFECRDGWVSLVIVADRAWQLVRDIWTVDVDPADERFATEKARRQNLPAIRELLRPVLQARTRREIFDDLAVARIVCGMLMKPGELLGDPHMVDRHAFVELGVEGGMRSYPRFPVRIAGEDRPTPTQAPAFGAGTFTSWGEWK